MGEPFPGHFTNEHEVLFYQETRPNYHGKNTKTKMPLMIKNQELLKENITSPEFNLFHMASPDLERLIVGQASSSETSTTNSRETTTINSSDLNVLNLVSPDFDKIFSNLHGALARDTGQDQSNARSVQRQHEVYTTTFVEALQRGHSHEKEDTNRNRADGSSARQEESQTYDFDCQKGQVFERRRNEHYLHGQEIVAQRQTNHMNRFQANYESLGHQFAPITDRNKNKIPSELHNFGRKSGVKSREDGNRNTIVSSYQHQPNPSRLVSHIYHKTNYGNNGIEDGNGNTIQAGYRNYANPNPPEVILNPTNPNPEVILNPANPNPSQIILDNHPELFKLHAHVKLSENITDNMGHTREICAGSQEVHTVPQMFPLPPIDLQVQEIVKRERKKQKNRVAASKCRKKKLEREAQLEVSVQQLRERNIELTAVATALRGQVTDLKQRVMEHIACGCHVTSVTIAY